MHVRQPAVDAVVAHREPLVVDAEQVQDIEIRGILLTRIDSSCFSWWEVALTPVS